MRPSTCSTAAPSDDLITVILNIAVADSAIHMPFTASCGRKRFVRYRSELPQGQEFYHVEIATVCHLGHGSAPDSAALPIIRRMEGSPYLVILPKSDSQNYDGW